MAKEPNVIKVGRKNAPGAGRPRVYATDLPVYDTMEQCSGATKIPMSALKYAKKQGCLFVRHGRVHLAEFIEWWHNQPPKEETGEDDEGSIDWVRRDKRGSAMLKEIRVEEERERVIDFKLSDNFITNLVNVMFFGELERIREEFSVGLEGKTKVQIYEEVTSEIEKIKESLTRKLELWKESKGKR